MDQLPSVEVLLAASALYSVRIHVYFFQESPVVYQCSSLTTTELLNAYLQCLGGIHFNPLVETKHFNINIVPNCVITPMVGENKASGEVESSEACYIRVFKAV